jgi:hypothetical protein
MEAALKARLCAVNDGERWQASHAMEAALRDNDPTLEDAPLELPRVKPGADAHDWARDAAGDRE